MYFYLQRGNEVTSFVHKDIEGKIMKMKKIKYFLIKWSNNFWIWLKPIL